MCVHREPGRMKFITGFETAAVKHESQIRVCYNQLNCNGITNTETRMVNLHVRHDNPKHTGAWKYTE